MFSFPGGQDQPGECGNHLWETPKAPKKNQHPTPFAGAVSLSKDLALIWSRTAVNFVRYKILDEARERYFTDDPTRSRSPHSTLTLRFPNNQTGGLLEKAPGEKRKRQNPGKAKRQKKEAARVLGPSQTVLTSAPSPKPAGSSITRRFIIFTKPSHPVRHSHPITPS